MEKFFIYNLLRYERGKTMYRCGNKVEIGDCVTIQVDVLVKEMKIQSPSVAVVLDVNHEWTSQKKPLLTLKLSDDSIQQIPASWCKLCQRK